jgi:squalene synthase HpnC
MGVGHYENFPVASLLLPAPLRQPIAAIYRFARTADDLADEGEAAAEDRLQALAHLDRNLTALEQGAFPADPLFSELGTVIRAHRLPTGYFHDLLSAFSQDCVKTRYQDFNELQDYARRSANPVGRLLLHLFGETSAEAFRQSDLICSALQYINFWQDVAIDIDKQRIYLPLADMQTFGVTEADIIRRTATDRFKALLAFQVDRTRTILREGAPLGRLLRGRVGLEIRTIVAGGDAILCKIIAADYDVFRFRPTLRTPDWLLVLYRAILGRASNAT